MQLCLMSPQKANSKMHAEYPQWKVMLEIIWFDGKLLCHFLLKTVALKIQYHNRLFAQNGAGLVCVVFLNIFVPIHADLAAVDVGFWI